MCDILSRMALVVAVAVALTPDRAQTYILHRLAGLVMRRREQDTRPYQPKLIAQQQGFIWCFV